MKDIIKRIYDNVSIRHCAVSLITAWCLVSCINIMRLNGELSDVAGGLAPVGDTNLVVYILCTVVLAAALFALIKSGLPWSEPALNVAMFLSVLVYGIVFAILREDVYTSLGIAGVTALAYMYAFRYTDFGKIDIGKKCMIIIIAVAAAALMLFVGVTSVFRYLCYSVPNYDGGLFFQMFYYMREHLTMQTTLERDFLVSHMNIHLSPDFWLIMPLYLIFPSHYTLQISQGIVLASAVIPLAMLGRKKDMTRFQTACVCVIYCFLPYVAGGCGYDMHENMFLPVAIFWLLYSFESDSALCFLLSVALLFGVKEDAAVYGGFIGLYMLTVKYKDEWGRTKALVLMAASVLYFAIAVAYIDACGLNTATNRFNNLIYEKDGNVLSILKTMLIDPGYVIGEAMSSEKIPFMITVLAPVLFVPVFCKDVRLYILAGPFIMYNLLPDYEYMHSIDFQYVFGSASLLLYMMMLNVKNEENADTSKTNRTLILAASCTAIFFATCLTGRLDYVSRYNNEAQRSAYDTINEALECIPDDAEVTASTFLCSRLADRDIIYEDYYTNKQTEYFALDLRGLNYDYDVSQFYEEKGYETLYFCDGVIGVFRMRVDMDSAS